MTSKHLLTYVILLSSLFSNAQNSTKQLENVVRIKFKDSFDLNTTQFDTRSSKGYLRVGDRTADALNTKFKATGMQRVFPYAGKFEEKHKRYGLHLWYDITVEASTSLSQLISNYSKLEIVKEVEGIYVYNHEGLNKVEMSTNDPRLNEQWHYQNEGQTGGTPGAAVSLFEAWEVESGDPRVVVAVHDSGIDTNHPDLVNRLWTNDGEVPNDGIDNDNNGFVDDYHGYNFAAAVVGGDPSSVYDYNGHGTHTAGTIGAENNNGVGVSGVAGGSNQSDGVRIMMMRLGNDYGSNAIYNPAPSFVYAADMGAVISSNSWGGGGYDQSLVDAINYFVAEGGASSPALEGGLVIMSSGNSGSSFPDYRSDLDGVMMVSATNHYDQKAWYSNYGQWVDISAPGGETFTTNQGVLSTLPNGYGFFQGTSMACPHVAGAAALLASKAYGSQLSRVELFDAIAQGANSIDNLNPSYAGLLGSGRLNIAQSLELVSYGSGGSSGELVIDPGTISAEIQQGSSKTFTIRLSNTSNFDLEIDVESEGQEWLDIEVVNLSIASNSTAKFDITLNSTSGGDYIEGEILFSFIGFDALEERRLPISLYTLGDPELAVQDTLSFGSNYLNSSEIAELVVSNLGTDYLEIVDIINSNSDFLIDFDSITLAPAEQISFDVIFTPSVGGEIIDSLFIVSNDPVRDSVKVVLEGVGNANIPPTLSLDKTEILVQTENINRYGIEQLTIENAGDEELAFSIQINPHRVLDLSEFGFESTPDPLDLGENKQSLEEDEIENTLDNLGDLSFAIQSPVERESGLAWDGSFLWVRDANSNQIYKFDAEEETIVDSISSLADQGVALAFDGEYLWEHDYRARLIKYSQEGDSVSQISLDQTRDYGHGISVEGRGIWMSFNGSFVQLDMSDGTEMDSFSNSYSYGLEGLVSLGNRIFTISNGRIYEIIKGQSYYNSSTRYIAGYYREETEDITFDGRHAWVSFNNYDLLLKIDLFQNFLYDLYPSNFILQAGESLQVGIEYGLPSYVFDDGFSYTDEVQITSNDPENEVISIPFEVDILGAPQIFTNTESLSIEAYIGHVSSDTLVISNEGNELLSLSSISSSDPNFVFNFSPLNIGANDEFLLPIAIELSDLDTLAAVLTISSNDPVNPSLLVDMEAIGYHPPNIEVTEGSLSLSLFESQVDSLALNIANSGQGDLVYYFVNEVNEPDASGTQVLSKSPVYEGENVLNSKQNDIELESSEVYTSSESENNLEQVSFSSPLQDVLSSLDENHSLVTSLIPNRYDFYDGENGTSISDGGNDMYDGGNYLSTDLGGNFGYTNGVIDESLYSGGGSYFTAKYEGLFVFASDLDNVNTFQINGNLGADGGGSVDGSVLSITIGGREFLGFVKRVYNAYDPSVNHLIIVQNVGNPTHQFDTYSNSDFHSVDGLSSVNRIYHLLFASSSGGYIDDDAMLEIMESFLDVSGDPGQVSRLAAGETIEDYVVFDIQDVSPGTYEYNLLVRSNDPLNQQIAIPTSLTVKSTPLFSVSTDTVDFQETHVGTIGRRQVHMSNPGSDTLYITGHQIEIADSFTYTSIEDTVPPGESTYLTLEFYPTALEEYKSSFTIYSNDRINPAITIPLKGLGVPSSVLELATSQVLDTVAIGTAKSYPFSVKNVGTDPLDFRVVIEERPPLSRLIEEIEEIKVAAGRSNGSHNSDIDPIAGYQMSEGRNRIIVLAASHYSNIEIVLSELESTNEFELISFINVSNFGGVSLHTFEQYDAILLWHDGSYNYYDPVLLGNTLADYVDLGGGVVTCMYENVLSSLGGRWSNEYEKYSLFSSRNTGVDYHYDFSYMEKDQPDHPLLLNVDTLNGGYYSIKLGASAEDLAQGAEVVASWNNGAPLIVAGAVEEATRVDLGFSPLSDDYHSVSWSADTDGIQILTNALNYVANYTMGRTEVDWLTLDDYEVEGLQAGDSALGSFIVDTEDLEEGWFAAQATFYSNDSRLGFTSSVWLDILADGVSDLSVLDTVRFRDLSLGFIGSQQMTVTNSGNGKTNVIVEIDTLSGFSLVQSDTIEVGPYSRKTFNFTYEANSTGNFSEVVTVRGLNDEFEQEVVLSINVTQPGVIRLEPDEVYLTVDYQGQTDAEFTIHNDGDGNLNFALEAFHLPNQLSNSSINAIEEIHFDSDPEKGDIDFRNGHLVLEGSGSDSFGYVYVDSNHEDGPAFLWNDISESGTEIVLGDDDAQAVELTFELPFYGLRTSKITIGSNGIVGVESTGITSPINQQIPLSGAPDGFIAPFWKDLVPGQNGKVFYLLSEENITVQYQDFEDYESTGYFTFQVVLYRSGDILFQYESLVGNVEDATVGIENQFGSDGLQIAFNTTYLLEGMSIYITHPELQIDPEVTIGVIEPGDSLKIPFTYNSLDDLGGIHERELSILSNDTSSYLSILDIVANVEGISTIAPTADTLRFDSTYIDIVSKRGVWFENDSVGVLTISSLESSNEVFQVLLPNYEASSEVVEDGVFYNISLNVNSGRLEGELMVSEGELVAIKAFLLVEGERRSVWNVAATPAEDVDGSYSIYDLVSISNNDLWSLAHGEIIVDVFTTTNLNGFGGSELLPSTHEVGPFEYSTMFPVLYKPTMSSADTAIFTVNSSAINNSEVTIHGLGVGLKSDVSISVSVSSMDAVLTVGDSTTQTFTITNNGVDSLSFELQQAEVRFESNLNPIGFDRLVDKEIVLSGSEADADLLLLRAPIIQKESDEVLKQHSSNVMTNTGSFYGFLYSNNEPQVATGQISDPSQLSQLLDVNHLNFTMASEFLPGSETNLVSLDYQGNLYLIDLLDKNTSFIASFQGDDDWWSGMTTGSGYGKLYASTRASLYELDLLTNSAIHVGTFDHYGMLGIAMNRQGKLYGYTMDDEFLEIDPVTGRSSYIGDIGFDAEYGQDLGYNSASDEFYMAAYNSTLGRSELRLVNVSTGNSNLIGTIGGNSSNVQMGSIAFPIDDTNLFFRTSLSDTILAPSRSLDIVGSFNAKDLSNGTHFVNLNVKSNDLSNPVVEIPISLEVTGNQPAVGDFTEDIRFGLHTVNETVTRAISFQNVGKEVLLLTLATEEVGFELGYNIGDTLRIDINQTVEIPVEFIPNEARTFEHDLLWNTNDPERPKIIVSLSGAGERASQQLEMDYFTSGFELARNERATSILKLRSVGKDTVHYTLARLEETNWLASSSDSTYIAPGDSATFIVAVDTEALELGAYVSNLVLTSDDPLYDSLIIPLTLSVYNNIPELVKPFPETLIAIGSHANSREYSLGEYIEDADSDAISYKVSSRNGGALFFVLNDTIDIFGLRVGADTLDIVASDGVDSLVTTIPVVVNVPPAISKALPDFHARIGDPLTEVLDLDDFFLATGSTSLEYSVSKLSTEFADISVSSENILVIKGLSVSSEVVTISAFDGYHSVTQEFLLVIDDALQIDDIQDSFVLYPNPVKSDLTFEFRTNITEMIRIRMVDITGKVLLSVEPELIHGKIRETLDVSALVPGIYVIEVVVEDKTIYVTRVSKE